MKRILLTWCVTCETGIFYEAGKEPGPGQEPKLHLLIESNEEFRVKLAVDELRRILLDASVAALVSIDCAASDSTLATLN